MSASPQLTPDQINYAQTAQWKTILRQALADLRVAIPAVVTDFDAAKQVVTVEIAIREVVRTQSGPVDTAIAPIYNVPVIYPSAGGFSLTLPIQSGDEGFLVFCDMCIDLWWSRGGIQNQFERRRHDLSDCGFIPGGKNQKKLLSNYSTDSAQLRSDDGSTYVEIAGGGIVNIVATGGLNVTGPVNVTGAIVATGQITGNGIPLSTHVHGGVQSGGSDTGPPIP